MIFHLGENGLIENKETGFGLEKDLQTTIEKNMMSIFGIKFLTTEFPISQFRFDSVGFDEENSSFVIFEYKRGRNESLVDQGYAYLNTVLDRKADLVLLFNEKTGSSKTAKDFDWKGTLVFFVSPEFTPYQRKATSFSGMPFRLYEAKQYSDGIFSVNQVSDDAVQSGGGFIPPEDSSSVTPKSRSKEIVTYTEEDHISLHPESVGDLYEKLKEGASEIGDMKIEPKKVYIAFKRDTKNVFSVEFMKSGLIVFIAMPKGSLKDPYKKARDISEIGHHGTGDYEFILKNEEDIDYLLGLIKQSFNKNV
jgi:predicted transport protein